MISTKYSYQYCSLFLLSLFLLVIIESALGQIPTTNPVKLLPTLWLVIAGSLVFFMNAGFAMLEAGLCRIHNSTNVLAKNLIVFCVSVLAFWLVGFGLMWGNGNSLIGQTGFYFQAFAPPLQTDLISSFDSLQILYPDQPGTVVFFFQLVFAGTTATIVSGAMAERVKFWAFFSFSFCLVAIAYPLIGRWVWHPLGWLGANFNFIDFAGSTVVHSVGGMAGLVGAILIGPRRGWQGYNPDEVRGNRFSSRRQSFNHYSLSLATLGCLILWLGWLGFNGGSARAIADVPHIIATTMLAGASGGVFVLLLRGLRSHKPPLSLVINGILGGLVSVTAASAYVTMAIAIVIGAVGSLCVILTEKLLEELKIDDPVGAVPVHLGCGIWGTLAAGLFLNPVSPYIDVPVDRIAQIFSQLFGILVVNLTVMILSLIFWLLIGLAIYAMESVNQILSQESDRPFVRDRTPNLGDGLSKQNIFYRYLSIARKALRVSQEEELQGSDGTFA